MRNYMGWGLLLFCLHATAAPEKIELGQQLFFDSRLSVTGRTSCLSCHNVLGGGEDGHPTSLKPDGNYSSHSAPTVWNAALLSSYFWYGQAATLEEQAEGPLEEMGLGSLDAVVKNVNRIPGYQQAFERVFPSEPTVTLKHITEALASYERTLITSDSRYDHYTRGDELALTDAEKRGLARFQTVGCVSCHGGVNFAGPSLPQGTPWLKKFPVYPNAAVEAQFHFGADAGRFRVTQIEADRNVWRVPPLRNIALTAPYFHNGAVTTLREAVRVMAKLQLNVTLSDAEASDIEAFLGSLTGRFPEQRLPRLPELPGEAMPFITPPPSGPVH